ncbi:ATPase, T2SS/T4P/T4SS family [Okeanomitos corallinicola TIOX110]|uniref:ATPase, T2SS/T4P/T4SS family n=1 Tax=Okeanomitos corallinicola TIOX110 TaxID=3133117 RepID=A0ABZ2UWT4_9CYAN
MTYSSPQRRSTALTTRTEFSPFGNKLVQSGYVDNEQMRQALAESRKSGKMLTDVLESITGKELAPEFLREYKKQHLFELKILYGVESIDPEVNEVGNITVGKLIENLIPVDVCRRHRLVPLVKREQENPPYVLVAMVDPDNLEACDDLSRILRSQGLSLQRMVITQEDYQRLINQYLDEFAVKQEKLQQEKLTDISQDIESLNQDMIQEVAEDSEVDLTVAMKDADDAPIINLANKILFVALRDGVSDIHIEPQEESLRIRFRKDGVLRESEAIRPMPKHIVPAVTARFKIISNLDIAERRLPQDGRIRRVFDGRKVDFRVNTLPSRYGEKICLRILDNSSTQLGLDKLITDPVTLKIVQDMVSKPFGLILVTGPTGSGKTTSLYSALAEVNDPGINISTVEDPVEYSLPGLTQVQVIREKGLDFATALRAFLRQDPDVLLVGETRDKETAKTAIEAALTGHLVLTTLHTNDAPGAIARLGEMGIEPFMVSSSLIGVLAQRLVRRVCSDCRIPYTPTSEQLARYGLSASQEGAVTFYKPNTLSPEVVAEGKTKVCPKCGGIGYKGRCGVYEVMRITENLQTLINQEAPTERIKEVAVEEGMKTLLAYSLDLVRQGATTLEEVERVTFTDTGLEAELKAKRKSGLTCKTCDATLQPEWLDCPYCLTPRFQD